MTSFSYYTVECCICMECIDDVNITTTECGHTFHSSCIFKNLSRRIECPICRRELTEKKDEEELENLNTETGYESSEESVLSFNDYQFLNEENGEICYDRYIEFKQYSDKRDTDPTISYQQIADKMLSMGITPADMIALYCVKISGIHTETDEDSIKYRNAKIHELDMVYRKIARGEISVDEEQHIHENVQLGDNTNSNEKI